MIGRLQEGHFTADERQLLFHILNAIFLKKDSAFCILIIYRSFCCWSYFHTLSFLSEVNAAPHSFLESAIALVITMIYLMFK